MLDEGVYHCPTCPEAKLDSWHRRMTHQKSFKCRLLHAQLDIEALKKKVFELQIRLGEELDVSFLTESNGSTLNSHSDQSIIQIQPQNSSNDSEFHFDNPNEN